MLLRSITSYCSQGRSRKVCSCTAIVQPQPWIENGRRERVIPARKSGQVRLFAYIYTEKSRGLLGKSEEGFHHRLEKAFLNGRRERRYGIPEAWSEPLPTREAAARELKKTLVIAEREFAAGYNFSPAGVFTKVQAAMRTGAVMPGLDKDIMPKRGRDLGMER